MATIRKIFFTHRVISETEIQQNRKQITKLFNEMRINPRLQEHYTKLITSRCDELISQVEAIGMERSTAFEELWAQQFEEKCPLDLEMQARCIEIVLNILSVCHALLSLKDEMAGDLAQIGMFGDLATPPDKDERGN